MPLEQSSYKKNKSRDISQQFADKLPPQNLEAEESLLGCLMMDKASIYKVSDFLSVEDFYSSNHQKIYQAILDLFTKNDSIDLLTVANILNSKDELEKIGGRAYLANCINSIPDTSNAFEYAKIIQKKKILRDLIQASYNINSLVSSREGEDIDVILDEAEQSIFKIAQKSFVKEFIPIKDRLKSCFEEIEKIANKKNVSVEVQTGFTKLDNILAGLHRSDFILLAARPSIGKTALALDIARYAAVKEQKSIGIFSLEMAEEQVILRLLAAQAGVNLWGLRTGKKSFDQDKEDAVKINHALDLLSQAKIFINDSPSMNVLQMKAMARRLQSTQGLDLIIIDYLQLIDHQTTFGSSIIQQMTEISKSLKNLARELKIPVLAISQLSRAPEQRSPPKPRLSDLRETGALEQDADVVMFIYREDKHFPNTTKKNIAEIIVAKHRNGPVGMVELYFDEQKVSFRNLDTTFEFSESDMI
jgi:replicative DNA helicase